MTDQPTLFDPDRSRQVRQDALDRVEANAHPDFKATASRAVRYMAGQMAEFTTDDVIQAMSLAYPNVYTHEPRAWGPIMRDAAREKLIANTGRVRESNMVLNHRRPKAVWRSLIYRQT